MTTTASALAFSEGEALLAGTVSSLVGEHGADAHARAKLLSTFGRVDALRQARSQDEFEAAFDLLATRRFFVDMLKMVADPSVVELLRRSHACEVSGHGPPVKDQRAAELSADLFERYRLLVAMLQRANPVGEAPASVQAAIAGWAIATSGVMLASFKPEQWSGWMPGMLWNFGRRALMEIASAAGYTWEAAVDGLATTRDQRLSAMPFDQAASDEALRLLGLAQ